MTPYEGTWSATAPHRELPTFLSGVLGLALWAGVAAGCVAQAPGYGLEPEGPPPATAAPYAPEFFEGLEGLTRFGLAISADGSECYYAVALTDQGRFREEIRWVRRAEDGSWSKPEPLLSGERRYKYVDPHFSPDGRRLYFIYTKPAEVEPRKEGGAEEPAAKEQAAKGETAKEGRARRNPAFDIYYVEREGAAWGDPVHVPAPIGTVDAHEYFVSLTSDRTIFFGSNRGPRGGFDLYAARLGEKGLYEEPEPLPGSVNTRHYEADVFVARDESFVVFSSSGREDGTGQGDLYVSFRDAEGNWGEGIHLGDRVNSKQQEFAPSISPDGKALFFSRGGTLHWVSTAVIEAAR